MHDAISVQKAGVPATAIITDRFVSTAHALAKLQGTPDYPFAIIPHPIASNTQEVIHEKARIALGQCLDILLGHNT